MLATSFSGASLRYQCVAAVQPHGNREGQRNAGDHRQRHIDLVVQTTSLGGVPGSASGLARLRQPAAPVGKQ